MKFTYTFLLLSLTGFALALPYKFQLAEDGDLEPRYLDFDYSGELAARAPPPPPPPMRKPKPPAPKIQAPKVGFSGSTVGTNLVNLLDLAMQIVQENKDKREKFASSVVEEMHKKDPKWNYLACAVPHKQQFAGVAGKDWFHTHREFYYTMGGSKGYEIYQFKDGEFWRQGDGGWMNWAFFGNVKKRDGDQGSHLVFGKP